MRKKLIAGNWKMHLNAQQASTLVHRLQERIETHRDVEVVLLPSQLHLQPLSVQIDRHKFKLGAQNMYFEDDGAFTGEVSATMLRDLVSYVLVGHSERRYVFGETDDVVANKAAAAVRNGIRPILCVGETATDKADGSTKQVIHDQVTAGLKMVTSHEISEIVIAYEPVWAISTGNDFKNHPVASSEDVRKAVSVIRHNVKELYGEEAEANMRVIYGGSSNASNAKDFLNVEGVDGLLPGGASLKYEEFAKMVAAAHEVANGENDG